MMLRRRLRLPALGAALLALLVGLTGGTPPELGAQSAEPPYTTPVKTLEEALKSGRVRRETVDALRATDRAPVLVRLRLPSPFRPEGELTGAEVEQQRTAIATAQSTVLSRLAGASVTNARRYRTFPSLAIVVDEAALTALVGLTEVLRVNPDRLGELHLGTSTTVVGSAAVRNALGNPGAGQVIAVIDSGVAGGHPFLAGKLVSEACYSDDFCPGGNGSTAAGAAAPCGVNLCDHGTHVAGIAAGKRAACCAFDGVASGAGLIAVQIAERSDTCPMGVTAPCARPRESNVLQGLERVYELRTSFQIAAVNLSFGFGGAYTSQARCDDDNEDVRDIIRNLWGAKIATVASSGNNAQNSAGVFVAGVGDPACVSEAIAVGATTNADAVRASSQASPLLDLLAPGNAITSSVLGGATGVKSGTSMAAPHVAGALAVLRALAPALSVNELRDVLIVTGKPITDNRLSPALTTARIQLDAAVEARLKRPLRPSALRISNVTGTSLQVDWTDNSRSETQFRVTATPVGGPFQLFPVRATVNGGTTSVAVSGLYPATRYDVTVRACDADGRCSADSDAATATTVNTLPCTPLNFRAGAVTGNSITVHWDLCPSSNPVSEFRIRTDATGSGSQVTRAYGAGERSATFSGLAAGRRYSFFISACNSHCSPESALLSVVTSAPPPPAAPSNLHLCGGTELCRAGYVSLSWTDNSGNEDFFNFEWVRATTSQPVDSDWARVRLAANDTGHALPNSSFSSGALYYFRVQACNAGGCSTYSNRVSYTAP